MSSDKRRLVPRTCPECGGLRWVRNGDHSVTCAGCKQRTKITPEDVAWIMAHERAAGHFASARPEIVETITSVLPRHLKVAS